MAIYYNYCNSSNLHPPSHCPRPTSTKHPTGDVRSTAVPSRSVRVDGVFAPTLRSFLLRFGSTARSSERFRRKEVLKRIKRPGASSNSLAVFADRPLLELRGLNSVTLNNSGRMGFLKRPKNPKKQVLSRTLQVLVFLNFLSEFP